MNWNNHDPYGHDHQDDDFGLTFAFIVLAALLIIVAGMIAIATGVFYLADLFLFGDIFMWYWEVTFSIISFPIVCFIISDFPKNPIIWYIHYKGLEVRYKEFEEDGEREEMVEWMDENIKGHWIGHLYARKFRFARKSDAMAFKLRWG